MMSRLAHGLVLLALTVAGDQPSPPDALDLGACFGLARARNEEVQRAQAAIDLAKAGRRAVRSGWLPELSLRDDFLKQERVSLPPPSGSTGNAISFADQRNQVSLNLSQPLLAKWTEAPRLDAADRAIAAAEGDRLDAERRLLGDVALGFYDVLRHEREVETLESAVHADRDRLSEISARQDVGLARRMEVLFVKTQLSGHESRLLRARNDVRAARATLASLTGADPSVPVVDSGTGELIVEDAGPEDHALDDAGVAGALERRPDLAAARERMLASHAEVAAARRGRAPTLDLGADIYLDRQGYSDFQEETNWAATLEFTLPILDGGRVAADVAASRARAAGIELERAALERDIRLEIRQAALSLESDRGELRTLEDAVAAAREAHELASEEYRAGLATNLEVLTAQQQLLDQSLALEHQRIQVKLSWIASRLALGVEPAIVVAEMKQ
jgi:outer membrane protein TolC